MIKDDEDEVRTMKLGSISASIKHALVFALVFGLAAVEIPEAQAQTFSAIYSFTGGSDGGIPLDGLMIDGAGNLYGTASYGGPGGNGVVFKVNPRGKETVLHGFTGGTDGAKPEASLVMDATGNLYGTTTAGGASGAGTVFKVTRYGKEKVLYTFTGTTDGASPEAALVMDKAGNLYGTTTAGGSAGNGTVFKLAPRKKQGGEWKEKVLYSFGQGTDGAVPVAGVTLVSGNLYGTTSAGGTYGYGTIFQLTPSKSGWTENTLYNFQGGNDGDVPYAGLIVDQSGNLYGAATGGGTGAGGTIFELSPSNGGWTFTVLFNIPGWTLSGPFRNLMMDASGNLYGTTHCDGSYGDGTVYELTPSGGTWTYTSLHAFAGTDGYFSYSNLVFDKQGNLNGTVSVGGANGYGVVFKIAP
jgi:uncharacterized repeat protein (TIGR03803 family)